MTDYQLALAKVQELGGYVEGGDDCAREVKLNGKRTTDSDLALLSPLRNAEVLDLFESEIVGPGLQYLRDWGQLRILYLTCSKLQDEGLHYLAEMPWLQQLIVDFTGIGDAGLKYVGQITELQVLNIGGTKCTDAGLQFLEPLVKLKTLYYGDLITDAGICRLKAKLPMLHASGD